MAELRDPAAVELRDQILGAVRGVEALPAIMARRLAQLDIDYGHDAASDPRLGTRLPPGGPWATNLAWARVFAPDTLPTATAPPARAEPGPHDAVFVVRPDGYIAAVEKPSAA